MALPPDHLHAVIRMRDGGDYSRLLQDIKKLYATDVNDFRASAVATAVLGAHDS